MPDQRSLVEQLTELRRLAIEHGFYDADDWIDANLRRYEPAPPLNAASTNRTTITFHQQHYWSCNCLADSDECCVPTCACHAPGEVTEHRD